MWRVYMGKKGSSEIDEKCWTWLQCIQVGQLNLSECFAQLH